jgi:GrpE
MSASPPVWRPETRKAFVLEAVRRLLGRRIPEDAGADDRATLVRGCIELRDYVRDDDTRQELAHLLGSVGVIEYDGAGEAFDASRHRALDTLPTDDATRHDVVAETVRVGYDDRGRVLRRAEVIVYRHPPSS